MKKKKGSLFNCIRAWTAVPVSIIMLEVGSHRKICLVRPCQCLCSSISLLVWWNERFRVAAIQWQGQGRDAIAIAYSNDHKGPVPAIMISVSDWPINAEALTNQYQSFAPCP